MYNIVKSLDLESWAHQRRLLLDVSLIEGYTAD